MNKRQKQKEDTKATIIKVAKQLYAKDGILTTTTIDIAKKSNVSHGTIFVHFPTKDSLIDAVIAEFGSTVTRRMHELIDQQCEMQQLLEAHLQVLEENEDLYIHLITEAPLLYESARYTLIGIQSTISLHISQVAEKEIKRHIIREMPVHLLFNTWIGLIHYYLTNKELFASKESVISKYGKELINHYMTLISDKGR